MTTSCVSSKVYLVKGQGSGLTGDRDYYDNSGNDQAFINFDLKADLSPLFNWNVKVNTNSFVMTIFVIFFAGSLPLPHGRIHY